MTQHILFVAAGMKMAVSASQVKAVHEQLNVEKIAGTVSWFLGLGIANGRLLPVTDLGAFAGGEPCSGRILEIDPSVATAAFRIDELSGFSDAPLVEVSLDEEFVDTKNQFLVFSGKKVKDPAGDHHMLDVDALVQSPAFINIKETNS